MDAKVYRFPLVTVNPLNARERVRARIRRVKNERSVSHFEALARRPLPPLPVRVTLTRFGRQWMDDDAVPAALKSVRDGLADAYGTGDGRDAPIEWKYDQRIGEPGVGVRIEGVRQ